MGGEKVSKIKLGDRVSVRLTDHGRKAWATYAGDRCIGPVLDGKLVAELRDVMRLCGRFPGELFVDDEVRIEDQPVPIEIPMARDLERLKDAEVALAHAREELRYIRTQVPDEFHDSGDRPCADVGRMREELNRLRQAAQPIPESELEGDDAGYANHVIEKEESAFAASLSQAVEKEVEQLRKACIQAPRFRITTNGVKFRVEERKKPPLPRSAQPWEWQEVWGERGLHADQTNGFTGFDTLRQAQDHRDWLVKAVEIAARPWVPVEEGS